MALNPVDVTAIWLWIINIGILVVGFSGSFSFYRKTKTPYAIGLGTLCIGFILGRIFGMIVEFDLGVPSISTFNSGALTDLNIAFWLIVGFIFSLGGISLFREKIKGKRFIAYWLALIIASIVVFYFAIFLINTFIGTVPVIQPFEGNTLIFQDLFLVFSWGGFIILFFSLETTYSGKTRYFFTYLTCVNLVLTLYENGTSQITAAFLITFISSMAGMGLIFIYMAVAGTGKIRKHSINLIFGHLLLAFAFAFNVPVGQLVLAFISSDILAILSPILHMFGLIFYYRGIWPLAFGENVPVPKAEHVNEPELSISFATPEQLLNRLKKAEREIEVLSGLLPYCPSCKKVRNDSGYWDQLEDYVKRQSVLKFTSSLCPHCMSQNHKLILTAFNTVLGPTILLSVPKTLLENPWDNLPSLMDLHPTGFFVHTMGNIETANQPFSIFNANIRGNRVEFLITYAVQKDQLDVAFATNLLADFIKEFTVYFATLENAEKIFGDKTVSQELKAEKTQYLNKFFEGFFNSVNSRKTQYYAKLLSSINIDTVTENKNGPALMSGKGRIRFMRKAPPRPKGSKTLEPYSEKK